MSESVRKVTWDGRVWNYDTSNPLYLAMVTGLDDSADTSGTDDPTIGAGMFPRNHIARSRRITLRGWCRGTGNTDLDKAASYRSRANVIRTSFLEGDTGVLSVDLEDGTTATINARVEAREIDYLTGWDAAVTVVLVSVDPHWVIS